MSAWGASWASSWASAWGSVSAPAVIVVTGPTPGHGSSTWRDQVTKNLRGPLEYKPLQKPKTVRLAYQDLPLPERRIDPERRKADRRQKRMDVLAKLVKRRKRAAIAALVMEIYGT